MTILSGFLIILANVPCSCKKTKEAISKKKLKKD